MIGTPVPRVPPVPLKVAELRDRLTELLEVLENDATRVVAETDDLDWLAVTNVRVEFVDGKLIYVVLSAIEGYGE